MEVILQLINITVLSTKYFHKCFKKKPSTKIIFEFIFAKIKKKILLLKRIALGRFSIRFII